MQYEHLDLEYPAGINHGTAALQHMAYPHHDPEIPEKSQGFSENTGEPAACIDTLVLMPNKDGTGPKGGGKQDGSGGGKGNQGRGSGQNKGDRGQGPKTGGKKGGCN